MIFHIFFSSIRKSETKRIDMCGYWIFERLSLFSVSVLQRMHECGWTFKRCCYSSSLLFNILPHTHQRCSWLASLCSRSCSPDWTIELQCSQLILCSVYKSSLSSYLDLKNILQRLHSDGCSCRFCLALKVFSQETHSINVFTSDCWFETPLDSVVHCELPRPCVEPACVTWHAMKLNGLF